MCKNDKLNIMFILANGKTSKNLDSCLKMWNKKIDINNYHFTTYYKDNSPNRNKILFCIYKKL